jgi:hypothetical protein
MEDLFIIILLMLYSFQIMYKQLNEVSQDLNNLREKGFQRGKSIGWDFDLLPYTVKLASTTYIASAPGSGKTEIMKEILINLSCLHGWNHVIFSPETGSTEEIYAEFCHSFIGKPYLKGENCMDESERVYAEMFIDNHFIIIDPIDKDLNAKEFYKMIDDIERDWGKTVHSTVLDPWNELEEVYLPQDLGREDKYVSRVLGDIRKNARATNRHHFVVTHVRDQALITSGGVSYYPMPHAREFSGGQSWFRKANTMLIPWRPPYGLSDNDNRAYESNELHLRVAKSKPKGVSKNGTYVLYLDVERYQYYLMVNGNRVYADRGEYNTDKPIQAKEGYTQKKLQPLGLDSFQYSHDEDSEVPF